MNRLKNNILLGAGQVASLVLLIVALFGYWRGAAATVTAQPAPVSQATKVYVLRGGHTASDNAVVAALEERGLLVTRGPETPDWNGSQTNLNDFAAVVILHNANWSRRIPAAGAQALLDFIRRGGGVVTGEWALYNLLFGSPLLPVLPTGAYCGWNSGSSTTYTLATPDETINQGLLTPSFSFPLSNFDGTESCLGARAGATVFYVSSNGGNRPGAPGLVGWSVEGGRVISFSTLLGATELGNANYRRLFCNAVQWAARKPAATFAVTGRVTTSDGRPLDDAQLDFTQLSGNGAVPDYVRTDANGNWRQTGFATGTCYRVTARRPGYSFSAPRDFCGESGGLDFVGAHPVALTVRARCAGAADLTAEVRLTPGGDFATPFTRGYELGQPVRLELRRLLSGQCGLLTVLPSFYRWSINGNPQPIGRHIIDLKLEPDMVATAEFIIGGQPLCELHGLNFSPYVDGQDPSQGAVVSEEQLRARLALIAHYTDRIRTFGCTNGLEHTGRIAREFGLQTAAGAWLSRDLAANEREIANLIGVAQAGHAVLLIVGSEVLLRGDLSEEQLINYINRIKQAAPGIPIATADVYSKLLEHPRVIAACDVVLPNLYGYWEGLRVDTAVAALNCRYQQVVDAAAGKTVIVSETGWPSCGDTRDKAVPSPENAAFYFLNFISWARANNVPYYYFAALDESWKAQSGEGQQGACWGVWDKDGNLKPGMQRVFACETIPDNWTMPGGQGQPRIELTDVPAYGSFDNLRGQVWHVRPEQHKVAVYIFVNGGWWTKPTFLQPHTAIEPSGRWVCDIVTGGQDQNAVRLASFLLPAGQSAPLLSGSPTLPPVLEQISLAKVEVVRQP